MYTVSSNQNITYSFWYSIPENETYCKKIVFKVCNTTVVPYHETLVILCNKIQFLSLTRTINLNRKLIPSFLVRRCQWFTALGIELCSDAGSVLGSTFMISPACSVTLELVPVLYIHACHVRTCVAWGHT